MEEGQFGSKTQNALVPQRQLATHIATSATADESVALASWTNGLLEIRESNSAAIVKAQRAIALTRQRRE
jgi:hypothetical protein